MSGAAASFAALRVTHPLPRRLGRVAGGAQRLQVVVVVRASVGLGGDVVHGVISRPDLERCQASLPHALLAEVVVALEDALGCSDPCCVIAALMTAAVTGPGLARPYRLIQHSIGGRSKRRSACSKPWRHARQSCHVIPRPASVPAKMDPPPQPVDEQAHVTLTTGGVAVDERGAVLASP